MRAVGIAGRRLAQRSPRSSRITSVSRTTTARARSSSERVMRATLAREARGDTRGFAWTRGSVIWTRGNARVATLQKTPRTGENMTIPHSPRDAARALDDHLALVGHDIQRWIDLFADD